MAVKRGRASHFFVISCHIVRASDWRCTPKYSASRVRDCFNVNVSWLMVVFSRRYVDKGRCERDHRLQRIYIEDITLLCNQLCSDAALYQ